MWADERYSMVLVLQVAPSEAPSRSLMVLHAVQVSTRPRTSQVDLEAEADMLEAQAEARADLLEARAEARADLLEARADLLEAQAEHRTNLQEAAADIEEVAAEEQEGKSRTTPVPTEPLPSPVAATPPCPAPPPHHPTHTGAIREEHDVQTDNLLYAGIAITPAPGSTPGEVALMHAAANGHSSALSELLDSGEANVDATDNSGRTVRGLHNALTTNIGLAAY